MALWVLYFFLFIAVFGDFISNEKPLFCRFEGRNYFPVLRSYAVEMGMAGWPQGLGTGWHEQEYDAVMWPPIPYGPTQIDLDNANFKGPFERQNVRGLLFRHWLGTDNLGRDVLAGLVRGCRIALLIGCLSMLLAVIVAVPLGAMAGYFGDYRFYMSWTQIVSAILLGSLLLFYIWQVIVRFSSSLFDLHQAGLVVVVILLATLLIRTIIHDPFKRPARRSFSVPCDTIVMRSIEVIRSVPAFFLLIAVLGAVARPSWVYVVLLIALWRVPSIVRYVRAEALKLRDQPYIDAARVVGLTDRQIIWRHIIPNSLSPVLVTLAFGIGGAVLLESGLSFLGVGLSLEEMSWGKLLSGARVNFKAWWLAVFPGAAIFLMIYIFNVLGDALTDILEVRSSRL